MNLGKVCAIHDTPLVEVAAALPDAMAQKIVPLEAIATQYVDTGIEFTFATHEIPSADVAVVLEL